MSNKKAGADKAPTKFLSAEEILSQDDLKKEVVDAPEWGGSVIVATMSGEQRDAFEASFPRSDDPAVALRNLRARIVAASCVDEDGNPLFSLDQVEALGRKSASPLARIAEVAMRLSRISKADEDELVKN